MIGVLAREGQLGRLGAAILIVIVILIDGLSRDIVIDSVADLGPVTAEGSDAPTRTRGRSGVS